MSYSWDSSKCNSNLTLSNNDRTITATVAGTTYSVISNWSKSSGKWYWEIKVDNISTYYQSYGVCDQDEGTNFDSDTRAGWGESWAAFDYGTNVRAYHDGSYTAYSGYIATGDILCFALDLDNNRLYFGIDGTWVNSGDPESGTGYIYEDADIDAVIAACLTTRYVDDAFTCCFEASQITYDPPDGYTTLDGGTAAPIEQHVFGNDYEGADSPSGTAGSPTLSDDYVTFDGDDGYYYGGTLDEASIEGRVVFRIEEDPDGVDGSRCVWKSGGSSNGIGIGIAPDITGTKTGYYFGIWGQASGADSQIIADLVNLSQNVWYEVFFSSEKITVRELDTPANGFTVSGTVTGANGSVQESVGYAYTQSPLTGANSSGQYFIGSVAQVDIYTDGDMVWPDDLGAPEYSALNKYQFGSSYDGNVLTYEEGTVTLGTDHIELDGTNGVYETSDWGDEGDVEAKITFEADSFADSQVLWKSGGYSNGIAFGISGGGVGIFGRSSSLTSITVSTDLLSTGTKYVLYATQTKVAVYNESETVLIGEATGTVTIGNGAADESVGFSVEQCPITAESAANDSYFDGKIYEVEIWYAGELSFPVLTGETEPDTPAQGFGLSEVVNAQVTVKNQEATGTLGLSETIGLTRELNRGIAATLGFGEEIPGVTKTAGSEREATGTLGLSETIGFNVERLRGVDAVFGLSEEIGNDYAISAGIQAGLGFSVTIGTEKEIQKGLMQALGLTGAAGALNFSQWVRDNYNRAVYTYHLTITGEADGLPDYEAPGFRSMQFTRREASASYLSCILAYDEDVLAAIVARQSGDLIVDMMATVNGLESLREPLIKASYDAIRYDRGGNAQSITVTGTAQESNAPKRVTLATVTGESMMQDGRLKFRCARPDFYLNPGDTAVFNDNEITVASMMAIISTTTHYMDVSE